MTLDEIPMKEFEREAQSRRSHIGGKSKGTTYQGPIKHIQSYQSDLPILQALCEINMEEMVERF
jgi:hypothetical protein